MIDRTLIEDRKRELPAMLADTRFFTSGPARPPKDGFVPLPPPSDRPEPDGFARMSRHVADKASETRTSAVTVADSKPKAKPSNILRGRHPNRSTDAQPCPYCGSNNTWSKSGKKGGRRRRVCKETGCWRSFLVG